ncbi:hypothetical protein [Aliikangiella sp. IMCC44359]|uniref:hypothetical protein n=1 Tax=Aliikangiella sp. IMCC44359 TaxID=3459125 RepID=UPI00403AF005
MINNTVSEIEQYVTKLVYRTKLTKMLRCFIYALLISVSLICSLIWSLYSFTHANVIFIAFIVFTSLFAVLYYFEKVKAVNSNSVLEHLNRKEKVFEESVHLIIKKDTELNQLQLLQKRKNINHFEILYQNGTLFNCLPKLSISNVFKVFVCCMLAACAIKLVVHVTSYFLINAPLVNNRHSLEKVKAEPIKIIDSQIKVIPPAYTQKKAFETDDLNLKIIENSIVEWRFKFSDENLNYFLINGSGNKDALEKNKQNEFVFTKQIKQTAIYRIAYSSHDELTNIAGVYVIEVVLDKSPKVKITQPNKTLVEIARTEKPLFDISAIVNDDFGINKVEIIASVAKGSGEAVKFRDEKFQFESYQGSDLNREYKKRWLLTDLNMEPGDEVYFSIHVTDNKLPTPLTTKSSSMIVRWLDEQQVEMAAEGLRINFIPEYFRSQRQIIIETEQLIADKNDLSEKIFQEKSIDLGQSQSDLKQKYGQYLGDEFGEGPGEQHGLADGYHGGEEVVQGEVSTGVDAEHSKDGDEKNHHRKSSSHSEVEHFHESNSEEHLGNAKQLIAQFTHEHNDIEVAALSSRDPKSWMKKAVNVMWQAELHLMLSEPSKALPYEYQAYQYLKLAKQAERIYVKRLGFEPPPVKEDNRLKGELKDIVSYDIALTDFPDNQSDQAIYKKSYLLLTTWPENKVLDDKAKGILIALKIKLLALAKQRSALINYATKVERLIMAEKLREPGCEKCLDELQSKLWQLMDRAMSLPQLRQYNSVINNEQLQHYMSSIKKLKREN